MIITHIFSCTIAAFHKEMKGMRLSTPSTAEKFISKLNFTDGLEAPLVVLDKKLIAKFERQNPDYALNVVTLKTSG